MGKKLRVGILHGAIVNSGDFLIYNRGKKLLERYLGEQFELISINRWQPITVDTDVLIILGGPLISRNMHMQSKHIYKYLNEHKIPIICLGLGISGEDFDDYGSYFLDEDSKQFWKKVYNSSNLFSVRDVTTQLVLKQYGIDTVLTGCPAFFDIGYLEEKNDNKRSEAQNYLKSIVVTIPNLNIYQGRNIVLTFLLINYIRYSLFINKMEFKRYIVFQHGMGSSFNRLFGYYSKILGFKAISGAYKGLDEIPELKAADIHIGTRLHAAILFASIEKPTYLFDVDNRTNAFLRTIPFPSTKFSTIGIMRLVNRCSEDMTNWSVIKSNLDVSQRYIKGYYLCMIDFIKLARLYLVNYE